MENVSKEAICLIDNMKYMDPNLRLDKLKNLSQTLTETLKRGEEKVALAKSTFEAVRLICTERDKEKCVLIFPIIFFFQVDRHCNRLDADLVKFEEDQTIGDSRITTLPGLQPSARSLKEGTDVRERVAKRLERKEVKGDRKSMFFLCL